MLKSTLVVVAALFPLSQIANTAELCTSDRYVYLSHNNDALTLELLVGAATPSEIKQKASVSIGQEWVAINLIGPDGQDHIFPSLCVQNGNISCAFASLNDFMAEQSGLTFDVSFLTVKDNNIEFYDISKFHPQLGPADSAPDTVVLDDGFKFISQNDFENGLGFVWNFSHCADK